VKQLLFYENVVPVSSQRHKDLSIERVDFAFAANVNSVPLTAVEIPAAAREYTVVFAGTDESVGPIVVLGVEGDKNQYVADDGTWNADYVPAFVRRYPFVFSRSEDGKQFTLCIDEGWAGCNREGRGERLFDDQGERTPYLDGLLKFLEDYQRQFQRTQAYCAKLKELGLLDAMQVQITLPSGEKRSLTGFQAANRTKIKELPAEKLAELVKSDELELTYLHLLSMNNLAITIKRSMGKTAPAEE
jgi:hypothetical protein